MKIIIFCLLLLQHLKIYGDAIYVDKGNLYTDHPLKVGELTITKTAQKSPLHAKACRDVHHCKITKNTTKLPEYHEFVQGAVSSFLVNTLQNRTDSLKYITQKPLIPLNLLELKTDLNCTKSFN
ncbi:Hypothetical predicted protein [Mytilus galloprovincialis]|uniref:Uncharacterized protein n=1 Tax=Mytilus galloprovincialis TaxID=29158 RepID=A0A8B6DH29_MYTGA|nr:Hypothetical predicted protein [Mytilus galloprovincialis]